MLFPKRLHRTECPQVFNRIAFSQGRLVVTLQRLRSWPPVDAHKRVIPRESTEKPESWRRGNAPVLPCSLIDRVQESERGVLVFEGHEGEAHFAPGDQAEQTRPQLADPAHLGRGGKERIEL